MSRQRAAIFAALFLLFAPVKLLAQDVTLTSPDGAVEITGTLLGFDGEFYRVDTQFGELTVDGSGVRCDGPACPSLSDYVAEIYFSGASAMTEVLMPALVEGFALRNAFRAERLDEDPAHFTYVLRDGTDRSTLARFHFRLGTTDEGFADLLANEADVSLALREIRPEEVRRAYDAGLGDMTDARRSRVIALDAMVPVVAPGNPVLDISLPDLARIFAGDLVNWIELGGPNAPISPHLPDPGSGLAQAVEDRLMRPSNLSLSPEVIRHRKSSDLALAVATDPFAIGLSSHAEIGPSRPLALTSGCGFSLRATRRGIKTEDYPLTAPMFLYIPARRLPKLAREFLAYIRSPAAQIVIRRAGFVDQGTEMIPVADQGDRLTNAILSAGSEVTLDDLQTMMRGLSDYQRLTLSFRFEAGSTRLDAQSRSNIRLLARALEAGAYDARSIVFVGFSDGAGGAAANREISAKRAETVHSAVIAEAETFEASRLNLGIAAYGEALPMACDDSAWGRQLNRRVEVWLK